MLYLSMHGDRLGGHQNCYYFSIYPLQSSDCEAGGNDCFWRVDDSNRGTGDWGRGVFFVCECDYWWVFNDHPVPVIDFLCLSVEMKCQTVKTINCLATSVSAFTLLLFLTLSISLSVFLSFHLSLPDTPQTPHPPHPFL